MNNPLEDFLNRPSESLTLDPAFLLYQQVLAEALSGTLEGITFAGKAYLPGHVKSPSDSYPFLITQNSEQMGALSSGVLRGTMHRVGVVMTSIDGRIYSDKQIAYEQRAFPEPITSSDGGSLVHSSRTLGISRPTASDPNFVLRYEAKYDVERALYVGILGRPGRFTRIEIRKRQRFEIKRVDPRGLTEGSIGIRGFL